MNKRCNLAITLLMVSTLSFADNAPTVSQCNKLIAAENNTSRLPESFFIENNSMIEACFNHCGTLYDAGDVSICRSKLGSLSFHASIVSNTTTSQQPTSHIKDVAQPTIKPESIKHTTKATPPTTTTSIRWF